MLCHTDLRPKAPEPVLEVPVPVSAPITVAPSASYGVPAADPLTAPLLEVLGVAPAPVPAPEAVEGEKTAMWPCTRCDAMNPITADACTVCKQPFLAEMRSADKPVLVLPFVGDIGKLSRGTRVGLAFAALAAVLLPLAVITLLLTQRPPADDPATVPTTPGVTQSQDSSGGAPAQ